MEGIEGLAARQAQIPSVICFDDSVAGDLDAETISAVRSCTRFGVYVSTVMLSRFRLFFFFLFLCVLSSLQCPKIAAGAADRLGREHKTWST